MSNLPELTTRSTLAPDVSPQPTPQPSSSVSPPPHGPVILNVCCDIGTAPAPLATSSGQQPKHMQIAMSQGTEAGWADGDKCQRRRRCGRMGPLFIVLISMLEIGVFVYDALTVTARTELTSSVAIPSESVLVYRPDRRLEVWRFVSYMVLHANCFHLLFNVLVQLTYGVPLELQHGSARIALIYVAGVVAGSLGTSVVDSDVYLVGASGGVYALLAAQLANILLNYYQMRYVIAQLLSVLIFAFCDLGYALYHKYQALDGHRNPAAAIQMPSVSYVAHVAGTLAGFTLGLLILKQRHAATPMEGGKESKRSGWTGSSKHLAPITWLAVGIYAAFTIFAVAFNLINSTAAQRIEQDTAQWSEGLMHQWGIT